MREEITYAQFEESFTILVLVSLGFSNKAIERETGLTKGQISYRIKKMGISKNRKQWRDGESQDAKNIIALGLSDKEVSNFRLLMDHDR